MIDFLEKKDQEEYKPVQKVRAPKIEEERAPSTEEIKEVSLISKNT